jgi:hypothetical protein
MNPFNDEVNTAMPHARRGVIHGDRAALFCRRTFFKKFANPRLKATA